MAPATAPWRWCPPPRRQPRRRRCRRRGRSLRARSAVAERAPVGQLRPALDSLRAASHWSMHNPQCIRAASHLSVLNLPPPVHSRCIPLVDANPPPPSACALHPPLPGLRLGCPHYVRSMSALCPLYVRSMSDLCPIYVARSPGAPPYRAFVPAALPLAADRSCFDRRPLTVDL